MSFVAPLHGLHRCLLLSLAVALLLVTGCTGCEDEPSAEACPEGTVWDNIQERCVYGTGTPNSGTGTPNSGTGTPNSGTGTPNSGTGTPNSGTGTPNSGTGTPNSGTGGPCINLACDQVDCGDDDVTTSLEGLVTTPNGELPLPNVSVYVPNSSVSPLADGASCERCEDMLTGTPLVATTTNTRGQFYLEDVPVGDNIPLVIQTGKWRRVVEVSTVVACTENYIEPDLTRLPRNQSEGDIPAFAVVTGQCDALECILYKIGMDPAEFTLPTGGGRIHMYQGASGYVGPWFGSAFGTDSFAAGHPQAGQTFPTAPGWWDDASNLLDYDILLHNCECTQFADQKSQAARQALQTFVDQGGRAFLSHWQNIWLQEGTADFQSVADWLPSGSTIGFDNIVMEAFINTSFAGGNRMNEWMNFVNALNANGSIPIQEGRITVQSIQEHLATQWLYLPHQGNNWDHYFGFNTPVGVPEEQECGRLVFSDLHVSAGNLSSPNHPFPTGCTDAELTPQEKALVYLLFDLSACITDCFPLRCDDIRGACGMVPDGCGSTIECSDCCVETGEQCEEDSDCCFSLWCDEHTGSCSDSCRVSGDPCTHSDQCCTGSCTSSGVEPGVCLEG